MRAHLVRKARLRRWTAFAGAAAVAVAALVVGGSGGAQAAGAGQAAAFSVTSFDGTTITGDFFTASGHRAPTVLYGPGWGGAAFTDPTMPTSPASGTVGVAPLLAAGYNVVSWNPRGFQTSTGLAEGDSAAYEGRDVSAILTWVAKQPWAQLDRPGDPRVGMVGGSYGGGVQWAAASIDRRIDAIVPDISWNSLLTSLDPNDTAKTGWDTLLDEGAVAAGQRSDPQIVKGFTDGMTTFQLSAADRRFLATRGPAGGISRVHIPTLIIQGTVDTLFPLREAAVNYAELSRNHVPVKMVWFCGGHGVCLTNPGDTTVIERASLAWLNRYVKREHVSTGPGFEWVDQQGTQHSAPTYAVDSASRGVQAYGHGTLPLVSTGGSGPFAPAGAEGAIVATPARNAVDVPIRFERTTTVLGAPQLSFTYRGTAPEADARVLAQVVDVSSQVVLGSQLTPIPVTLDGRRHTVTLPLEYLAAVGDAGSTFTLQLVADSSQFATYPTGGSVTFSRIHVWLPTSSRGW